MGAFCACALLAIQAGPPKELVEDFENRQLLNLTYDEWEPVVQPPDHPAFNEIDLERDAGAARSGSHFIRMRTHGGHVAFRMTPRAAWRVEDASKSHF